MGNLGFKQTKAKEFPPVVGLWRPPYPNTAQKSMPSALIVTRYHRHAEVKQDCAECRFSHFRVSHDGLHPGL